MSREVKRPATSRRQSPDALDASEPPGFAARRTACLVVGDVLRTGIGLDERLAREPQADPLMRALAVTTFRRFGSIISVLEQRLAQGLPAEPLTMALLSVGVAQLLYLDVPDHAAVDLTVEVARRDARLRHLAGLANAVLRRVARDRAAIADGPALGDMPHWLAARWAHAYGPERAEAIAAVHRLGAAVDVTVKSDPAGWADRLGGIVLPTGSVRLLDRTAISDLPGYEEGNWWVQDAAAALPVRLLAPMPGDRVLDLCAAPGGKTAQIAAAGAHVTALDRSEPRLRRLRANMERLRLAAEVVHADALAFEAEPFDAVLLDAPCTATGTIRRHPDVAWTKRETDLASLARLQSGLFDRAAALVRPGGKLVYCVCSLEPEEGDLQVQSFLARRPEFARVPVVPGEIGLAAAVTRAGDLRTVPDQMPAQAGARAGIDGFFAARLSRAPA